MMETNNNHSNNAVVNDEKESLPADELTVIAGSSCQTEQASDQEDYDAMVDASDILVSLPAEHNTGRSPTEHVASGKPDPTAGIYMPEELLDSDNSDTAGLYEVAESGSTSQTYQSGRVASSSSESSDDDGSLMERWRRRRLITDSSSESSSDSSDDDDNNEYNVNIDLSKVKVQHNILKQVQSRSVGDFGHSKAYSSYKDKLTSNLNFVRRFRCVEQLEEHEGCVNALNFNSAGNWLASGSDDMKVIIWDMKTCRPYLSFASGHHSNVFQTKFMPYSNDSQVVTCARDGQVRLSELSVTGACRSTKRLAKHEGSAHKLAIENDSPHCLLSAGEDSAVFQIDLRAKKPTKLLNTTSERRRIPLHSIDKHPFNPYEFVVSGKDHFLRVYDKRMILDESLSNGVVKKFYPHKLKDLDPRKTDVTCAVYNYSGTEILGTYNDDDIYLFDSSHSDGADCIKTYTGHRNSATVKGVNFFGPNSEYIVSGSDCGNVILWDKESMQAVQLQKGDEGGVVNVLEPHPHYPYLAVSGLDHDVKVFMPVGEKLSDMSKHSKLMKTNIKERSSRSPEEIDGHLLWSIMRHIESRRRRSSRRAAAADADLDEDDEMDTESNDDEADERSRQALSNVGCVTS